MANSLIDGNSPHLIEGETAYPIYSISAGWIDVQKESRREYRGERDKWLPDDRCFNSTGFDKMFQNGQTEEQLQAFLNEWWEGYKAERDVDGLWLLPKLTIKYLRHEVWTCSWFNHFTFDDGRSDAEYVASFQRFVDRTELANRKSKMESGKDAYCLMGADDRWRWRGENDNREQPICRCDGCKKRGVVGVNH